MRPSSLLHPGQPAGFGSPTRGHASCTPMLGVRYVSVTAQASTQYTAPASATVDHHRGPIAGGVAAAGAGVVGRRRAVRRRQTSASTTASVAALAPMTTGTGRARHASKGTNPAVHPISPIATTPISGTYVRNPERGRATGRTTTGSGQDSRSA